MHQLDLLWQLETSGEDNWILSSTVKPTGNCITLPWNPCHLWEMAHRRISVWLLLVKMLFFLLPYQSGWWPSELCSGGERAIRINDRLQPPCQIAGGGDLPCVGHGAGVEMQGVMRAHECTHTCTNARMKAHACTYHARTCWLYPVLTK